MSDVTFEQKEQVIRELLFVSLRNTRDRIIDGFRNDPDPEVQHLLENMKKEAFVHLGEIEPKETK